MKSNPQTQTKLERLFVFAVVTISFSLFVADVDACQCRERDPACAQYASADVVFVGSVIKISRTEQDWRNRIDFSMQRTVKGLSSSTVQLVNSAGSCDVSFAEGKTYLVYAFRDSERKELYTHYCTRTTELSNATSDLAFLNNRLSEKRQSHQILGVLADNDKRVMQTSIVASSGGRKYRTTSDKDGRFMLNVPGSGRYRVRIHLPLYADVVGTDIELRKISNRVRTRTSIIIEYEVIAEPNSCSFINPPLFIDQTEYEKNRPKGILAKPLKGARLL
jgi:hypothetical protein